MRLDHTKGDFMQKVGSYAPGKFCFYSAVCWRISIFLYLVGFDPSCAAKQPFLEKPSATTLSAAAHNYYINAEMLLR